MNNCVFSLCHLFDGLLLGIITGVISGLYTAVVAERVSRFNSAKSDALRSVRSVDYVIGDPAFKKRTNEQLISAQTEFMLLGAELRGFRQGKAADELDVVRDEFGPFILAPQLFEAFGDQYADWQKRIRKIRPSRWQFFKPW